jgi:transketolase
MSDVLQQALEHNDTFMVGAADLTASTLITHKKSIAFNDKNKDGQNIYYGVREFAMAAINNGITAHGGCKAITATFLAFSDYNKNAIRLAAISHVPAVNVYSHDTITVGEDGPTHQPIEQIPTLRLIPNHYVFRPANLVECELAMAHAVKSTDRPITIITSRGSVKQYPANLEDAKFGGYVIHPVAQHQINIIATGSEVPVAIEVSELLKEKKIKARVISMPCVELFESQGSNYKESILDDKPTVSIEFAATTPWYKYADLTIGINQFGKSAKPADVIDYFDLTPTKIIDKIHT